MLEWSGYLGVGASDDAGGVAGGEAADAFFDGVGDIQLLKNNARGEDNWRMLLPLHHQRIIRGAPRNNEGK